MSSIAAVDGVGPQRVIVLSGWALDSTVWLAARALTDVLRFTYAYVDFPGYGVNARAPLADGIDGMAQLAFDAAAELGWAEYAVLGHSMGGGAALRMGTLRPEAITAIAAVTPVSPAGTPLDAETYAAFDNAWDDPATAIRGSLAPRMGDDDLRRLVARNRSTMTRPVWSKYLANWTSSPSFMDSVAQYRGPVTLIYGENDPFVTADYLAETLAQLRRGTLAEVPGSGHYPMIENPTALVPLFEAALQQR